MSETLHLAHVLTRAVKGLLTGSNEVQPKRDVFSSAEGPGKVRHWVARLEFQDGKRKRHGRGTIHVHLLLWLEDMQCMDLASKIRADVPAEKEEEMRDLVVGSQLDYMSSGPVREEPTKVSEARQRLQLHHPICRTPSSNDAAHLPDVLAARCHVDVLASDSAQVLCKPPDHSP